MEKLFFYLKINLMIIILVFVFSFAFSENTKTSEKKDKTTTSQTKKADENKDKKESEANNKDNKEKADENKKEASKKDFIYENDINLDSLSYNNQLTGLYSIGSDKLQFNTSVPYKNNNESIQYSDFYNVANPNFNIKKSSDIKIYNLDRMYCTGIDKNSSDATQMIFINNNGDVFVNGIFKGIMQKIKILGVRVPIYNKNYKPSYFKEYYIKNDYFDSLEISGFKCYKIDVTITNTHSTTSVINTTNVTNNIDYKDYFKRRITKHLDTILRERTVFLAFDSIEKDENNNLTAYFYLKNSHCLNKSLIEDGFALIESNISKTSNNNFYFFDEFLNSQNIAEKLQKGIHYSKKEKILKNE